MPTSTVKVFVYGTLKQGGYFAKLFDKFRLSNKLGKTKGTMFNVFGSYPGLVLTGNTEIKGEVHVYSNAKTVEEALDRIEGFNFKGCITNLYDKQKIIVNTEDGEEECLVYIYARDVSKLEQILDGEWKL